MAVGRIGFALKMDLWKAAVDEMREDVVVCPLLLAWWTLTVLAAPLWIWPLLLNLILWLFAWRLGGLGFREAHKVQRRLYVDEDGVASKDLVKEAFKTQLSIMQLTETLNEAASQVEKLKFVFGLEDRCLSSLCFVLALLGSLVLCVLAAILYWLVQSGVWRYILWLPGSCVLMPKALRSPTFQFVQRLEKLRLEFMGDDLDRLKDEITRIQHSLTSVTSEFEEHKRASTSTHNKLQSQVWSIEEFRKAQEAASPSHHSQKSYQPLVAMTASQGSLYPGTGSVNVPQPISIINASSPRRSPSLPQPVSPHSLSGSIVPSMSGALVPNTVRSSNLAKAAPTVVSQTVPCGAR
ncbi:unnamed protein product [Symbiodinium necroappetens]|uniref:Uncharacterized protein n=1 Tax=Symbiodinium necroappetens TaxID=1628268 RepID=A0A812WED2_9DINO|nr:unnamed protein product [Symbiodinium necroappetens]